MYPVEFQPAPKRPAYFWWFLVNVSAFCFAIISWIGCLHIFDHIEQPRNYEILRKLKRLPELKHRDGKDLPPGGNTLYPSELYSRYHNLDAASLSNLNQLLFKSFLTNFKKTNLLNFASGQYQVISFRPLNANDTFPDGWMIQLQALVKQDPEVPATPYPVVLEYLLTTQQKQSLNIKVGEQISLQKLPHSAAIIHISKKTQNHESILYLTTTPLVHGRIQLSPENVFELSPPKTLNPRHGLPINHSAELMAAPISN